MSAEPEVNMDMPQEDASEETNKQENAEEEDLFYLEPYDLERRLMETQMPANTRRFALGELRHILDSASDTYFASTRKRWLVNLLRLPWQKRTELQTDITQIVADLDESHFGMQRVKDYVVEYVALQRRASKPVAGPILCLVGPPGVGKTTIAHALARALKRKFALISLASLHDAAYLSGFSITYSAAEAGQVCQALIAAGSCNPLIVLDEIDKMMTWHLGDPAAALLPVLDPRQNAAYHDHYMGSNVPIDLSEVMWVATANDSSGIPGPLKDRLTIIELPGYSEIEKLAIAQRHLVPRQLAENDLSAEDITIAPDALAAIITRYTFAEAGVREMERQIGRIMRRVVRFQEAGGEQPAGMDEGGKVRVTAAHVPHYLGPPRVGTVMIDPAPQVGAANALAQTDFGGRLSVVEAKLLPGSGKLLMTGSLAQDLQESIMVALTALRTQAQALNITPEAFERNDIHVHFPEGHQKAGPSAGLPIALAMISALTGRPMPASWAFTAEVSLRGHLLPVGGMTHKLLGAYRAGVSAVIIPRDQDFAELEELPSEVLRAMRVFPARTLVDAVKIISEAKHAGGWD